MNFKNICMYHKRLLFLDLFRNRITEFIFVVQIMNFWPNYIWNLFFSYLSAVFIYLYFNLTFQNNKKETSGFFQHTITKYSNFLSFCVLSLTVYSKLTYFVLLLLYKVSFQAEYPLSIAY